ncbi:MAG: hypothetical protein Q4E62_08940 [Sutterellaceae bacterium]|nr:hypothetical protein [Sutterellaceae bacterium]
MKKLLFALLFVSAAAQAFQLNQDGTVTTDDNTVMAPDGSFHSATDARQHPDGGLHGTLKDDAAKNAEAAIESGGQGFVHKDGSIDRTPDYEKPQMKK